MHTTLNIVRSVANWLINLGATLVQSLWLLICLVIEMVVILAFPLAGYALGFQLGEPLTYFLLRAHEAGLTGNQAAAIISILAFLLGPVFSSLIATGGYLYSYKLVFQVRRRLEWKWSELFMLATIAGLISFVLTAWQIIVDLSFTLVPSQITLLVICLPVLLFGQLRAFDFVRYVWLTMRQKLFSFVVSPSPEPPEKAPPNPPYLRVVK